MKKIAILLAAFHCSVSPKPILAEDLTEFGIDSVVAIADAEAESIRGQGTFSTSMSAYQIFAFDPESGTSINLQSSNISTSENYISMQSSGNNGEFALSDSSVGMSDMQININEFTLEIASFNLGSMGTSWTDTSSLGVFNID